MKDEACQHNELIMEYDRTGRWAIWFCADCHQWVATDPVDAPPPAYRVLLSAGVHDPKRFTDN